MHLQHKMEEQDKRKPLHKQIHIGVFLWYNISQNSCACCTE